MIRHSLALFGRSLFRNRIHFRFLQTKLTQQKLTQIRGIYRTAPSMEIFQPLITNSSDYFRVFALIQRQTYNQNVYSSLRQITSQVQPQNDNMLLLRGKISFRIAENYAKSGNNKEADRFYNQSLEIFEQSLIPQVLQYYTVYRSYGLFLASIGEEQRPLQILSESVQILSEYVKHSEDPVTSNYHSKEQAKACVKLIYLDRNQRQKWLNEANKYWKECQQIGEQRQYAETVYENTREKAKTNKKKAYLYAEMQKQKIKNEELHQIINRAIMEIKQKNNDL